MMELLILLKIQANPFHPPGLNSAERPTENTHSYVLSERGNEWKWVIAFNTNR